MFRCLSVFLFRYIFSFNLVSAVFLSISPHIWLFRCLSSSLCVYLSCLSNSIRVFACFLFVCLNRLSFRWLSACLSISPTHFLPICLSVYLSVSFCRFVCFLRTYQKLHGPIDQVCVKATAHLAQLADLRYVPGCVCAIFFGPYIFSHKRDKHEKRRL